MPRSNLALCALLVLFTTQAVAADYVPGRVLVKTDNSRSINALSQIAADIGALQIKTYSLVDGLSLYQFDSKKDINDVIAAFSANESVLYAEPDYIYSINQEVNDPDYSQLWGLENHGQTGGTVDADINAEQMWGLEKGSRDIVIGIIDTGMDYTHPDLIDNVWSNDLEIAGNGRDDDGNGLIDDIHGMNAINNSGDPMDDNVHGTHVAGTIGASGNNGIGVVGVAQNVRMAACKFLSSGGSGSISDALQCMQYFAGLKSRAQNPVNLVATNNSWGGGGSSQSMLDAIREHERLGILFIAAAGNESNNNDVNDRYPCNYDVPNVISVAATDHNDNLASFSNYGKNTVDVAAPGVKIYSTALNHGYRSLSGTSMASPHVAGLAAVIASANPDLDYVGIKNLILTGGQKIPAAKNTTISQRRIRGADVDGVGSLTCLNQSITFRQSPSNSSVSVELGKSLLLEALHINCAEIGGSLTVYDDGETSVVLQDNGDNGDKYANDGVYSLLWTPNLSGNYDLIFSDEDTLAVSVYDNNNEPGGSYVADDTVPFEYEYIQGTKLNAGDESLIWVRIPFGIPFGGSQQGFSDLYISTNGNISFTDDKAPSYKNSQLPLASHSTLVAPFWDDLIPTKADSDIYADVVGEAPHRRLIVEWWDMRHYRTNGTGTFQVIFYEDSSDIRMNYLDTNFGSRNYDYGRSATIGVQTTSGEAVEYSYRKASVRSQSSILFRQE